MKTLKEIEMTLGKHKQRLFSEYPIKSLAIFGSYARREQNEESDLDILVEFNDKIGLRFIDLADDKSIDAVVRNFEIIGEAANRIDPDFRTLNSEIEWNRIRGFRNRIVHDYFGIDYEIVWTIIEDDLDNLIEQIEFVISNSDTKNETK